MKNKHGIQSPKSPGRGAACRRLGPWTSWTCQSTRLALVPHPTSRALAQCGDGTARSASRPPRGRRTWPCRYGRRCLVTGTSRFRALCLAARNRKENTPAPHVPAGPGPSTATAAEITDFPVLEREPFPFRTGCFLFLQVPCRTVAPCVQPVTGTRTRASERTEGSRGLDSAAGKEQRSARRRFLQVTTEK